MSTRSFCFVIKFNDFSLSWIPANYWIMMEWWKEDNWFVLLWEWHNRDLFGKSKNRRVFIALPSRLEILWNFSFVLLHCPNKRQFFVFNLICKVNSCKEIVCCNISPTSVLTSNRLNECAVDITCQSTSYLIIFFAQVNFRVYLVFRGIIIHHQDFDSVLAWGFRHIFSESISSSEWKLLFIDGESWTIKYNDLHKPMYMSQIYRNAAILPLKRRSVLVALWSTLITDKRKRKQFFAMTTRKTDLPVSSILYGDSMCSCEDSNALP
jgi:hypothetical protein